MLVYWPNSQNVYWPNSQNAFLLLKYDSVWSKDGSPTDEELKEEDKRSRGFPDGSAGTEPTCQCRRRKRHKFNPWVWKIPGEGYGNQLQYSCPENSVDRGAWRVIVHGVPKNWTRPSACTHTEGQCSNYWIHILMTGGIQTISLFVNGLP